MAGDDRGEVLRLLGRAEIDAARLPTCRKAAAYAHVTLCAAMVGDEGRMARCLEQAERYRRNLPLLQQVNVSALLCRASLTVGAREFAQVMADMAADCACRIRSIRPRREALQICVGIYLALNQARRANLLLRTLMRSTPNFDSGLVLDVALALASEGWINEAINVSIDLDTESRARVLTVAIEACTTEESEVAACNAVAELDNPGLRAVARNAMRRTSLRPLRKEASGG